MNIGLIVLVFILFCIFPTLTIFSIIISFFAIKSYYIIIPGVIVTFIIDLFYISFIAKKIDGKSSGEYDEDLIQRIAINTIVNKK